jgi:hypothetical protein
LPARGRGPLWYAHAMKLWCRVTLVAALAAGAACGKVPGDEKVDVDGAVKEIPDAVVIDATWLGTEVNPAAGCGELLTALGPVSGIYWVKHPDPARPSFQVHCEQELEGGGWALIYNSVLKPGGGTTEFWQIMRADRFQTKGELGIADNYYAGGNYFLGTSFLDTITDLAGTTAVGAVADSEGIDAETMKFKTPVKVSGHNSIFGAHFASGWSSPDFDGDPYTGTPPNCANYYSNVTQHYGGCWAYSLGSDADLPYLDGGVGPHVNNGVLTDLGLALQGSTGAGSYSQVNRISRYVRF